MTTLLTDFNTDYELAEISLARIHGSFDSVVRVSTSQWNLAPCNLSSASTFGSYLRFWRYKGGSLQGMSRGQVAKVVAEALLRVHGSIPAIAVHELNVDEPGFWLIVGEVQTIQAAKVEVYTHKGDDRMERYGEW
jgi:hypothetical protein